MKNVDVKSLSLAVYQLERTTNQIVVSEFLSSDNTIPSFEFLGSRIPRDFAETGLASTSRHARLFNDIQQAAYSQYWAIDGFLGRRMMLLIPLAEGGILPTAEQPVEIILCLFCSRTAEEVQIGRSLSELDRKVQQFLADPETRAPIGTLLSRSKSSFPPHERPAPDEESEPSPSSSEPPELPFRKALEELRQAKWRAGIGYLTIEECTPDPARNCERWELRDSEIDLYAILDQLADTRRNAAALRTQVQGDDLLYASMLQDTELHRRTVFPSPGHNLTAFTTLDSTDGSIAELLVPVPLPSTAPIGPPSRMPVGATGFTLVLGFGVQSDIPTANDAVMRARIGRLARAADDFLKGLHRVLVDGERKAKDDPSGRARQPLSGLLRFEDSAELALRVLVTHDSLPSKIVPVNSPEDRRRWLERLLLPTPRHDSERREPRKQREPNTKQDPEWLAREFVSAYEDLTSKAAPLYVSVWQNARRLVLRRRIDGLPAIQGVDRFPAVVDVLHSQSIVDRFRRVAERFLRIAQAETGRHEAEGEQVHIECTYDPEAAMLSRKVERPTPAATEHTGPLECELQLPDELRQPLQLEIEQNGQYVTVKLYGRGAQAGSVNRLQTEAAFVATLDFEWAVCSKPVMLVPLPPTADLERELRRIGRLEKAAPRLFPPRLGKKLAGLKSGFSVNLSAAYSLGGMYRKAYIDQYRKDPLLKIARFWEEQTQSDGTTPACAGPLEWYARHVSKHLQEATLSPSQRAAVLRAVDAVLRPEAYWDTLESVHHLERYNRVSGLRRYMSDAYVHAFEINERVYILTAATGHRPFGGRGPLRTQAKGPRNPAIFWEKGVGAEFVKEVERLFPNSAPEAPSYDPPKATSSSLWSVEVIDLLLNFLKRRSPDVEAPKGPPMDVPMPPQFLTPFEQVDCAERLQQLCKVLLARRPASDWQEYYLGEAPPEGRTKRDSRLNARYRQAGRHLRKWTAWFQQHPETPEPIRAVMSKI